MRADLVFFETPDGGAVFSTGSIAWAGALAHDGYDNNVARITTNVVRRFLDPRAVRPAGSGRNGIESGNRVNGIDEEFPQRGVVRDLSWLLG